MKISSFSFSSLVKFRAIVMSATVCFGFFLYTGIEINVIGKQLLCMIHDSLIIQCTLVIYIQKADSRPNHYWKVVYTHKAVLADWLVE